MSTRDKILVVLAIVLGILGGLFIAAPADANEKNDGHWIRVNKVTKRDKVTDDISVYTTIWYKSGTTKPDRKGKMIVKPIKQNYRYIDYRDDSCDKAVAALDHVSFQTTIEGGNAKQKFGWRRIACNPDGQDSITFKLDSPVFKYFKSGQAPRFDTDIKVVLDNWKDVEDHMHGYLFWLELATPSWRWS